ncbi:MAG: exo-alpha-sialidase [Anaerolineae bacterium]|nr:MAG: exo-alpha-sialidase [Anaerolineae bacterium]
MKKQLLVLILVSPILVSMTITTTTGLSGLVASGTAPWTTGGPYGGYVNSLAMAASNPDVIYAGTEGGLFKTVDGGVTWTTTGFPKTGRLRPIGGFRPRGVQVVQVDPADPQIVYAGTDDGLFKSQDGGSTWGTKRLSGARVQTIAIDPLNPDILFAGTGEVRSISDTEIVGIFKSTNAGDTWVEKYDAAAEDAVMTILIDADDSSYIYVGTFAKGSGYALGRSIDGGETWLGMPLLQEQIVALAMTPPGSSPAAIYALAGGADLYKSIDSGQSWIPTNVPDIPINPPYALAVDPNDPNVIYVGKYKSIDAGATWSLKANGLPPGGPSSIVIDPRDSAVYDGFSTGGVYASIDGAQSWNASSLNGTFIEGLAIDPTSSDTVFAAIYGYGHHLAKTTDGGTSWGDLPNISTNRGALTIDPQNPSAIYAGFGWALRSNRLYSLQKSADAGQSWTSTGYLFSMTGFHRVGTADIWVKPNDSSTILVAVAGYGTVGGGVYKSTNSGATWSQTYSFWATSLASDPTNDQILYFGTQHCGYVKKSIDAGSSWSDISPSAPSGGCPFWEVRDIEVALNSRVYAATDEGLVKWDGSSWTQLSGLPTSDITALAIDRSTSPETIYAGTGDNGVFVSEDEGTTWISFNEGLGNLSITKLAIGASQPKTLYAGTAYGGVWKTTLAPPVYEIYLPLVLRTY